MAFLASSSYLIGSEGNRNPRQKEGNMKKIINWLNSIDSRMDEDMEVKYMIALGVGFGVIFWTFLALMLAAFGN